MAERVGSNVQPGGWPGGQDNVAQSRESALVTAVALSLNRGTQQAPMLQECAEAIVTHLDAAFARIWLLQAGSATLSLEASAGQYTHLDGAHSSIALGQYKIGKIAKERLPHLTNRVLGDPLVHDQEWVLSQGMVAFAGYPLLIDDRVVGVLALFARRQLSSDVLNLLKAVSDALAVGIDRLTKESDLVRANNAKDELLGLVSHELRTPITVIKGAAEVLLRRVDQIAVEERDAVLLDIVGHAARLETLIENMLLLAQPVVLDELVEPILLQRVVTRVVEEYRRRGTSRRIGLNLPSGLPPVAGRAVTIDQVLQNLLSNADKYSPAGGEIRVAADARGAEVVLTVNDEGSGVPEMTLDTVFNPFFRGANVTSTVPGLGLGLSVCKRLVEAAGGRIWATAGPTGGLQMNVALPLYEPD